MSRSFCLVVDVSFFVGLGLDAVFCVALRWVVSSSVGLGVEVRGDVSNSTMFCPVNMEPDCVDLALNLVWNALRMEICPSALQKLISMCNSGWFNLPFSNAVCNGLHPVSVTTNIEIM